MSDDLDGVVLLLSVLAGLVFASAFVFHTLVVKSVADLFLDLALEPLAGPGGFFGYRSGLVARGVRVVRTVKLISHSLSPLGVARMRSHANVPSITRSNGAATRDEDQLKAWNERTSGMPSGVKELRHRS